MLYTIYLDKSTVSFFSMHKLRLYVESNPSKSGWYTVCDGRKVPKQLRLEDIKVKEINELERKMQARWR